METIDSTYGSDQQGLVWGYHFVRNQPARSITSESAAGLLIILGPGTPDQFLWLHFSLANSTSETWLRENLSLPDAFYESLHSDVGATRLGQDANALVAVIQDVLFGFKFDASAMASTSLCIEPRILVSVRLRPLRSVDKLKTAIRAGQGFRSTVELLAHLLRDQSNVLVDILRQTTDRADHIEDLLLANRITTSRSELGSMRRVLVRLQRRLAPEPAAFFRLLNRPPDWITEEDLQDLRQAAEEFAAAVGDAAARIERIKLLQEEVAALVNEQTSRSLFVLTVVTVLALPINLAAGLFGMNVGGIPLAENDFGFFLIVGFLLTLTALLAYLTLIRFRD